MSTCSICLGFFFQAEDGIRDLVRSRGLGDVYKRQHRYSLIPFRTTKSIRSPSRSKNFITVHHRELTIPVSYTHLTAADERSSVDLGGRRIIKKKNPPEQISRRKCSIKQTITRDK